MNARSYSNVLEFVRVSFFLLALTIGSSGLFAQQNGLVMQVTDGLRAPVRIALDNQGFVYVTDVSRKSILKYDASGNFLEAIQPLAYPLAIAVDNKNRLVCSDNRDGSLHTLESGGTAVKLNSQLAFPADAVFGPDGKLYVVDNRQKRIVVLDPSGNIVRTFGEDLLVFPTGIAYDRKNARILVAEHGGTVSPDDGLTIEAKIRVFDLQGGLLTTFGEFGDKDGQFTRIQGLAVDSWGRIYALDNYRGTVNVFSEDGRYITRFGGFGMEAGELNAPMDIAIDGSDRIWVTSMNNGSVEVYGMEQLGLFDPGNLPGSMVLMQNFPNPFRNGTWIPFVLSEDGPLTLNIFNLHGDLVHSEKFGFLQKGNYTGSNTALYWDGTTIAGQPAATGIYLYEIQFGDTRKVRRMIILK